MRFLFVPCACSWGGDPRRAHPCGIICGPFCASKSCILCLHYLQCSHRKVQQRSQKRMRLPNSSRIRAIAKHKGSPLRGKPLCYNIICKKESVLRFITQNLTNPKFGFGREAVQTAQGIHGHTKISRNRIQCLTAGNLMKFYC